MRTFIAIEAPTTVKEALATVQEGLAAQVPARSIRWTRPDAHHVTLHFLGQLDRDALKPLEQAMLSASRNLPRLKLHTTELGCFPSVRHPSVVWIGIGGDVAGLHELHDRLFHQLRWLSLSKRAFKPHLTLGRVKGSLRDIGPLLQSLELPHSSWQASHVTLFESKLEAGGARYEILAKAPLGG